MSTPEPHARPIAPTETETQPTTTTTSKMRPRSTSHRDRSTSRNNNSSHLHHHAHSPNPHKSPFTSFLRFLVLILPPLLYLASMSLTIYIIHTPDFVRQNPLDRTSEFLVRPDLTHHLSPWYSCPYNFGDSTDSITFSESCVRRDAIGAAGLKACETSPDGFSVKDRVCEKIVMTAELYTAGAVLIGIAALVSGAYAISRGVLSRRSRSNEGFGPAVTGFVGSFAYLLGLGGAGCLVAGQSLGYDVMVVELSPFQVSQFDSFTRFFAGDALVGYTSAAYALAFGASFVGVTRCGLRR